MLDLGLESFVKTLIMGFSGRQFWKAKQVTALVMLA